MRRSMQHFIAALVGVLLSVVSAGAQTKPWVAAYYAGWEFGTGSNGYLPVSQVDFTAMTHVIHFCLVPRADGSVDATSNSITPAGTAALTTAAHAVGTKVIISIGGWATEPAFLGASAPATLNTFVSNLVNFMKNGGYDGIDIDWEPISSSSSTQFQNLIRALRSAMGSSYLLLTTAAQGEGQLMAGIQNSVDQINIMTYDLSFPSQGWVTWYNSAVHQNGVTFASTGGPVPACDNIVQGFLSAGVAASKIGIGSEFGGFVWQGGATTGGNGVTGPQQSWTTTPTVYADVPLYAADGSGIMQKYYTAQRYHWDSGAQASYLSIDNTGSSNDYFISYEDTNDVNAKFNYVRQQQLGGMIIYSLGMGYPGNGTYPMLALVKRNLGGGSINPPPTDAVPPTVTITAPANGSTIQGTVTVSANASDNVKVAGVTFTVDGTQLGSALASAPYIVSLVTTSLTNGTHTISATAMDAAGNSSAASVTVTVDNTVDTVRTADLWIYQDALSQSWSNGSWGATASFNNTQPAYGGSTASIRVDQSANGALRLLSGNWNALVNIDPTRYLGVSFAIYAASPLNLSVFLMGGPSGVTFPTVRYGTVQSGQWKMVSVPMSQLNPTNQPFTMLVIQNTSGKTVTYYVDNLSLTAQMVPILTSPQNGATNVTDPATFAWNPASGAESYRIQVATNSGFSPVTRDTAGVTGTSVVLAGLNAGTGYYWRVAAIASGTTGNWTAPWTFTTAQAAPPTTALSVYQDALQSPWMNASWNATLGFSNTTPVFSGTSSISVAQGTWGAASLHYGAWNSGISLDPSRYAAVQFEVYSPTGGSFALQLENDGGASFPSVNFGSVPPNQWTLVSVPLKSLSPSALPFTRIDVLETSGTPKTYYLDNIQLTEAAISGSTLADTPTANTTGQPTTLSLGQNYPNPFNPSTSISFTLPVAGDVTLKIYNMIGQEVATLVSGYMTSGSHSVAWNARNLPSGVYIYSLQSNSLHLSKKMTLLK